MMRKWIFLFLGLGLFFLLQACGAAMEGEPSVEEPAVEEPAAPMPTGTLASASTATLILPTSTVAVGIPVAGGGEAEEPQPVIHEARRLTLEFPPKIRAGDSDLVRLTLEVDDLGNITPTAEMDGNEIIGEVVEIRDLYETHYVIAEAKMNMAGVEIVPSELISEPLLRGESVTFYWSVLPEDAGVYRGRVWFYLRFVPKDGGKEETRTITSQPVEISATTFLGFKAGPARTAGAIGSFLGAVLGFPFVDDVLKFLWKRFKK